MSEIEVKVGPRSLFGYVLIVIGLVIIIMAVFQAVTTVGTVMDFIGKLMPNPTFTTWSQQTQAMGMPGFAETLSWFFMLVVELVGGYFIANIGLRIAKE